MSVPADVYTADEIARAAGVPYDSISALVESGAVRPLPGTWFFTPDDAVRAGKEARRSMRESPALDDARDVFTSRERTAFAARRQGLPTFASTFVHAAFIATLLWLTSGTTESAPAAAREHTRLVFLALPGPGGGGGGGGLKNPLPPPKVQTRGAIRRLPPVPDTSPEKVPVSARRVETPRPTPTPVPKPTPVIEDPLPSKRLIAPVVAAATNRERTGVVEETRETPSSAGPGTDGGSGTGRGTGDGSGGGAGLGAGSGGGTGGGPYRAGSGVSPPRLLREVKAIYTDDARRRGITGNVLLEIVITRDGSVSNVSVLRGLGAGLDERAIDAVRQWKFSPARRLGETVDVIVEVAVEFMLR
jgi:TonB family protein